MSSPHNKILSDVCAVPNCLRPREPASDGKGYYRFCSGHRWRWKQHRDVRADIPLKPMRSAGRVDE